MLYPKIKNSNYYKFLKYRRQEENNKHKMGQGDILKKKKIYVKNIHSFSFSILKTFSH